VCILLAIEVDKVWEANARKVYPPKKGQDEAGKESNTVA
jgi:hypothetical protein